MKHAETIMHRFSDEYVSALVAGNDPRPVLDNFLSVYPELQRHFQEDASILNSMYGDFRTMPQPSEEEMRKAYQRVTEKLETAPTPVFARSQASTAPTNWRPAIFGSLRTLTSQTNSDGQKVVKFKWSPWKIGTFAMVMGALLIIVLSPAMKFGSSEFRIFSSPFQTTITSLAQPNDVTVTPGENGSKVIQWKPVANASSYVVTLATPAGEQLISTAEPRIVIESDQASSAKGVKIQAVTKDLRSQPATVPNW